MLNRARRRPGKHTSYFDLRDALTDAGCAVCRLGLRAIARAFDALSYEQVNDPGRRAELRAARGFCNHHAWQFLDATHDGLGIAIIYRDVITAILGAMDHTSPATAVMGVLPPVMRRRLTAAGVTTPWFGERLLPQRACPACLALREATERSLGTLVEWLDDGELAERYAASAGLCLPHLAAVLPRIETPAHLRLLIHTARRRLATLREAASSDRQVEALVEMLAGMEGAARPADLAGPREDELRCNDVTSDAGLTTTLAAGTACPLCAAGIDAASACLQRLGGRVKRDTTLREQLARARGLCNLHGWRLLRLVPPADVVTVCRPALESAAADLETILDGSHEWKGSSRRTLTLPWRRPAARVGHAMKAGLRARAPCPACHYRSVAERDVSLNLSAPLSGELSRQDAVRVELLCLGHLALTLRTSGAPRARIVAAAKHSYRALLAELDAYIRRNDYRFRAEPWGAEFDAPRRALARVAGAPGARGIDHAAHDEARACRRLRG